MPIPKFSEEEIKRFYLNFSTCYVLKKIDENNGNVPPDDEIKKHFNILFKLLVAEKKVEEITDRMVQYSLDRKDVDYLIGQFNGALGEELKVMKLATNPETRRKAEKEARAERFGELGSHVVGGLVMGPIVALIFNIIHWLIVNIWPGNTGQIVSTYLFSILCIGIGALGIRVSFLSTLAFFGGALFLTYLLYSVFGMDVIFLIPGR